MNRTAASILALLLCLSMLLWAAPSGDAASPVGETRPRMRSITASADGDYRFTLPEELVTLAQQAAESPNQIFSCSYEGSDTLTISSSLTIPENMYIYTYTAPDNRVQIPSGVTLSVNGFFGIGQLDVQGALNVAENASVAISQALSIPGEINLEGMLSMLNGLDIQISGAEKIHCGSKSYVWFHCSYENEADIREIFSVAGTSPAGWYYDCYNSVTAIHLSAPLTVPYNCVLSADISDAGETVSFTGSPITLVGEMDVYTETLIANDLFVEVDGNLYVDSMFPDDALTIQGSFVNEGYGEVYSPVIFGGKTENYGALDVWYDKGGRVKFEKSESYYDDNGEVLGVIWVDSAASRFPADAISGMDRSDFGKVTYDDGTQSGTSPYWGLWEYKKTAPTQPEDTKTVPMYRLYNPNSGEHFYTGSAAELSSLTNAGWKYEGIAWNAPTTSGAPVYRLYNPNNGDHHYTMSAQERENLVAVGWKYEGVAWNSAPESENSNALYRLYNPNADCGSHHYTGSVEEREYLKSLGWRYEGIGWFGLR